MLTDFSYCAPQTEAELFEILRENRDDAKLLAGGTDLLVDIRGGKIAPKILIDIKKIPDLKKLSFSDSKGLEIGAALTCSELIENRMIRKKYPLLVDAASCIGSPQVRNRATVGGNICTASPCADLAVALLCLGASVQLGSQVGTRLLKLKEFFTGVKRTALRPGEALLEILVPPESADAACGMEKLKRIKGHDLALASVALMKKGNLLRIAIGSCDETPVVLRDLPTDISPQDACDEALRTIHPISDVRASKEFRAFMVQIMINKLMKRLK